MNSFDFKCAVYMMNVIHETLRSHYIRHLHFNTMYVFQMDKVVLVIIIMDRMEDLRMGVSGVEAVKDLIKCQHISVGKVAIPQNVMTLARHM